MTESAAPPRRVLLRLAAILLVAGLVVRSAEMSAQQRSAWRSATAVELKTLIPARAPVEKERIETEFRTASGITDGRHRFIAGVVLITAGYSAEGKYSHFLIAQAPVKIGAISLPPGQYVFGWTHKEDSLAVNFYEAATGKPLGTVDATLNPTIKSVASFRVWPPNERSVMQIGRFSFSYQLPP